jgi:dolichol-phosphate mannosyltransferase
MIFVVLPCYNEAPNLVKLIPKIGASLKNQEYQIIAVNDGSSDNTGEVLSRLSDEYPVRILTHQKNMGLQAALKSGLSEAVRLGKEGDIIITMDSDDTHDPRHIMQMLEKIGEGADVIIASRYVQGGKQINVPPHRVFLSWGINRVIRLVSGVPARDLTSGYRAYRWECLKRAFDVRGEGIVTSQGFEVSVELLVKVFYFGNCRRMEEVPLYLDYGRKEGGSKMNLKKTMAGYLKLIPKIRRWKAKKGGKG